MQMRQIGPLRVSAIGLGYMGMTPIYGQPDEGECIATVQRAVDLGVTMIDTADMYGGGKNEELSCPVRATTPVPRPLVIVLPACSSVVRSPSGVSKIQRGARALLHRHGP